MVEPQKNVIVPGAADRQLHCSCLEINKDHLILNFDDNAC